MLDPGYAAQEEVAPAALTPEVCRGRASGVYETCLRECNVPLDTAERTKTGCLTQADQNLTTYLRQLAGRVTPELLLQGSGLRAEIDAEYARWDEQRWACEDEYATAESTRDGCAGGGGLFNRFPHGCEAARRTEYEECIGICPQGGAQGLACVPQSAQVPSWAECGTLQSIDEGDREGECDCFSNEGNWPWHRDRGSYCKQVLSLMREQRYGRGCGNSPGFKWTPQVQKTAEGAPSGVRMRCVRWNGSTPDFSTAFDPAAEGR
jgi:hypothetical protein